MSCFFFHLKSPCDLDFYGEVGFPFFVSIVGILTIFFTIFGRLDPIFLVVLKAMDVWGVNHPTRRRSNSKRLSPPMCRLHKETSGPRGSIHGGLSGVHHKHLVTWEN